MKPYYFLLSQSEASERQFFMRRMATPPPDAQRQLTHRYHPKPPVDVGMPKCADPHH